MGYLVGTGTPGPAPYPIQSCPEQHKAGFEWKKGKEHSSRSAEPVPSCSGPQSPTPHAEVSATWRVWVLMEAPWQGVRKLLGQVF